MLPETLQTHAKTEVRIAKEKRDEDSNGILLRPRVKSSPPQGVHPTNTSCPQILLKIRDVPVGCTLHLSEVADQCVFWEKQMQATLAIQETDFARASCGMGWFLQRIED